MTQQKTIVCLANSRKHLGRCIAGIEVDESGEWIRPVSARPGAEVSEVERQYEDGSDPKVLDIVSVPLIKAAPAGYQSENWLLDPERYWVRKGRATWDDLEGLESDPAALWPSSAPDTYYGANDRVPSADVNDFDHSLRLILVEDLVISVFAPSASFGNAKRRVQGGFTYLGAKYRVWVSDAVIEREYLAKADGKYLLGKSYITMSLSEPHNDDYCYKLIAAVISPGRAEGE
ncbi:MAG: hypothetical protein JWM49_897 [Microbacteriaceae bacterium]|nr:hypothetical protein [Microbacteriaceae bacterium]